jgi:small subunit ribosomal protein S9
VTEPNLFMGTGRRKTAVARVFLRPGSGKVVVNGRRFEEYFPREGMRAAVRQPLVSTENGDSFDLRVNVFGGGIYGQSEAVRLGVARALLVYNSDLRPTLRRAGFLTRDPRAKERKKYGQKGARKRFQYSKR